MSRIRVTGVLRIIFKSPVSLISVVVLIIEVHAAQVMDVCSFDMHHVSEEPVLGHVKGGHLEEVVTAVLQHHAVLAGLFGSVDQIPAFLYGHGCRNFYRYVLSVLHGINCHWSVGNPVSSDINQVDAVVFAELLPSIFADILLGARLSGAFEYLLSGIHPVLIEIAKCYDLAVWNVAKNADVVRSPVPDSDETDPYKRNWIAFEFEHVSLTGFAWRDRQLDHLARA
jgi:hypothetical protein